MTTLTISEMTLFGRENIRVYGERPSSIAEFIHQSAETYPDKTAVSNEQGDLTYREFERVSKNLAAYLQNELHIRKGDRVASLIGNSLEFPIVCYACAMIGAIMVPINTKLSKEEIAYILNHSGARTILHQEPLQDKITDNPHLESQHDITQLIRKVARANLVNLRKTTVEETDPAYILYTSGTTGRPKGAVISHINVIHSVMNFKNILDSDETLSTVIAVPMFHVTGLVGQLLHQFYNGGTVYSMERYQNEAYIELVQKHKINFLFNVPTIFIMMSTSRKFLENDFSFVRKVAYGGAPIYRQTYDTMKKAFPNADLHNAYGSTETTSPTTLMPAVYDESKVRSCGRPVPVADVKIVDENGEELPAGHTGELYIRGPMVVEGYWDNEEANLKNFTDGYWHSGDLGTIDEEGFVYILDRKKDMINRGGEKIFSIEVEDVLKAHPEINEAAVVGEPDSVFGERVKAFIVSPSLNETDIEAIRSYCLERLAKFKVPESIVFLEELPRNAAGKILKTALKNKGGSSC